MLPFQLIGEFGWYTILGVAFASFFYLGLLAIGSELEQPFGYDEVRSEFVINFDSFLMYAYLFLYARMTSTSTYTAER